MAISFSPIEVLNGWKDALMTPFGAILLIGVAIWIYLRVTGRIGSPINLQKGRDNQNNSQKPNYIIK